MIYFKNEIVQLGQIKKGIYMAEYLFQELELNMIALNREGKYYLSTFCGCTVPMVQKDRIVVRFTTKPEETGFQTKHIGVNINPEGKHPTFIVDAITHNQIINPNIIQLPLYINYTII